MQKAHYCELQPRSWLFRKALHILFDVIFWLTAQSVTVTVLVNSLPVDSSWSPAELHIHSTWPDRTLTLNTIRDLFLAQGFRIVYVTDYIDPLKAAPNKWIYYVQSLNPFGGELRMYPGVEITTNRNSDTLKLILGLVLIVFDIINWGKAEAQHPQSGVINKGQSVLLVYCGARTLKSQDRCLSCGK